MENSAIIPNIRIRKITLTNFRNIVHSEVEIPGGKLAEFIRGDSSILGLYGQNGSGKTSLLMAINALKTALSGDEFPYSEFSSCIRAGCKYARLEFALSAYNEKGIEFEFFYAFSMSADESAAGIGGKLKRSDIDSAFDIMGFEKGVLSDRFADKISEIIRPKNKRITIFDEVLQMAGTSADGRKINKQVLIDTSEKASKASGKSFGNKTKYLQFTENCDADMDIDRFLYEAKIEARISSTSFIFSVNVVNALINGSSKLSYKIALKALHEFGNNYLFVILMSTTAVNNMKMLPLSLWINDKEKGAFGMVYPLMLFEHCKTPEKIYPFQALAIESISKVISTIVPGLTVEIEDIGKTISEGGQECHLFDLISVRNGVRIPLVYESDGIRRIVSFLSLMVAAYNNPSVTIAIDEMDSGIFEYMLGEILSIMQESAKGQLIFTSHNLRPLEVLPYKDLLFTTINPENRFAKLEGISGNNNLRDAYFRSIILGSGKDSFYASTDTFNIEQALYEAGLSQED